MTTGSHRSPTLLNPQKICHTLAYVLAYCSDKLRNFYHFSEP